MCVSHVYVYLSLHAQAVGIKTEDVSPVTNTEKLGLVDHERYEKWAGLGLTAIAKGKVSPTLTPIHSTPSFFRSRTLEAKGASAHASASVLLLLFNRYCPL